ILHAATHGSRELYAGGGARAMSFLGRHFPGLMDRMMASSGEEQQLTGRPADHSYEGLHQSRGFHRAEGDVDRDHRIHQTSVYGLVRRHPVATAVLTAAGVAAAVTLLAPQV